MKKSEFANYWHLPELDGLELLNARYKWLIQSRVHKARRLLKQGLRPVDIAIDCGFSDQSHLNRHFKKYLGVTPTQYIHSLFG